MKGFFSFIIVLIATLFLINIILFLNTENNTRNELITKLIEIENYNSKRTIIENNVDKIIDVSLNELLINDNFNLKNAKTIVNGRLFNYLKKRSFEYDIFFYSKKDLTLNYLNKTTSIELIELKKTKFAYFYFTGGEFRNKKIGNNFGQDFDLIFKIPIGYNKKVVVFDV